MTDALADELDRLVAELSRFADKPTGSIRIDMNDVRTILSALREREPVAWRVVWKNGQPDFRKTEAGARALARRFPDHEGKVQPLYTASTPEHQEEQS